MKKILAIALVALITMSFVFAQGGSETTTTVSESGFNTSEVLTFVIPGSTVRAVPQTLLIVRVHAVTKCNYIY